MKSFRVRIRLLVLPVLFLLFFNSSGYAQTNNTIPESSPSSTATMATKSLGVSGDAGGGGGSTILPDLFTATFSYSVPIQVPPGRKGMVPQLALRYSSQSGSGWLGHGWNLDIPYIQRIGPNKSVPQYDDNKDTFIFFLNGSSIELKPRSEWGAGYYGAKIEGLFSKFYKDGTTGGWIVTNKDGSILRLGTGSPTTPCTPSASCQSRQDNPANRVQAWRWYLDRVQDTNGNYITYSYTKTTSYIIQGGEEGNGL